MREHIVAEDMYVRYEGSYVVYDGAPCRVLSTRDLDLVLRHVWPGHGEGKFRCHITDPKLVVDFPSPRYINLAGRAVWVYRSNRKTYRRAPTKPALVALEAGSFRDVDVDEQLIAAFITADYPLLGQSYKLLSSVSESVALSPDRCAVVCPSGITILHRLKEIGVATSEEEYYEIALRVS